MLPTALFLVLIVYTSVHAVDWDVKTALDEYVFRPDDTYKYDIIETYENVIEGVTVYITNMTSQTWIDENFSSQPVWWHFVGIAIPHTIKYYNEGFLFINGGSSRSNRPPPSRDDLSVLGISLFANDTGMIGAFINQIPNQPIVFGEDPLGLSRSEDTQIAYTWKLFMENPNRTDIVSRMPMTKAAARALDTVTDLARQMVPLTNLSKFIVAGASKRGWTTMTLACVDRRVIAMAPMVMDLLNFKKCMMHHYQSLGGNWSYAVVPYYRENLTEHLTDDKAQLLANLVDPYEYRERLTMPKMFILGSGDQFFLLDDSHYFWDDLPGQNYMMLLPNTGHSMAPHYLDIYDNMVIFTKWVLGEWSFPSMSWTRNETADSGYITLTASPAPDVVWGRRAETLPNDTRRDFRLTSLDDDPNNVGLHPVFWSEEPAEQVNDDTWRYEQQKVDGEWVGTFIECQWRLPEHEGYQLRLMTEAHIFPDVMPVPPCTGDECKGHLV